MGRKCKKGFFRRGRKCVRRRRICCRAYNARCMACTKGWSVKKYCKWANKNKRRIGGCRWKGKCRKGSVKRAGRCYRKRKHFKLSERESGEDSERDTDRNSDKDTSTEEKEDGSTDGDTDGDTNSSGNGKTDTSTSEPLAPRKPSERVKDA